VRSLQEGWAQVEPPSPGAPPAIIDRGPLCQQHASIGGVPLPPARGSISGMVLGRLLASASDSPKAQFNGLKVEAPVSHEAGKGLTAPHGTLSAP
jgi:hypothetical protein